MVCFVCIENRDTVMWSRIRTFLSEVKVELKKVSWPSRQDTLSSTGVVIVVTTVISFYLGFIDILLSKFIQYLLGKGTR
jgi:preprotein translocase subunit SecE